MRLLTCILLLLVFSTPLYSASKEYEKFNALDDEKKEKVAAKKAKKEGEYFVSKVGRYYVYSDTSAKESYWWALLLDSYTDEALDEGVVPKTPVRKGKLSVYVLKDKPAYEKALSKYNQEASWSVGMFIPRSKNAALLGYNYRDLKELVSTMLHECTHQLVYYHIGDEVPVWFNEGIATNLETYDTELSMKANLYNAMYLNNRAIGAVKILEENHFVDFPLLFNMSGRTWNGANDKVAQYNYCSAWASCNFIFTTKVGRKFVGKFIQSTRKGGIKAAEESISEKDQDKISDLVKEHVKTILLPCVKYGRYLRTSLNEKDIEKAKLILEKMKAEFPESNEMKFYQAWIDIIDNKEPEKSVETIESLLKTTDFYHPEVFYVTALGYFKAGNKSKARVELKSAQKINPKHPLTIELAGELK